MWNSTINDVNCALSLLSSKSRLKTLFSSAYNVWALYCDYCRHLHALAVLIICRLLFKKMHCVKEISNLLQRFFVCFFNSSCIHIACFLCSFILCLFLLFILLMIFHCYYSFNCSCFHALSLTYWHIVFYNHCNASCTMLFNQLVFFTLYYRLLSFIKKCTRTLDK